MKSIRGRPPDPADLVTLDKVERNIKISRDSQGNVQI